MPAFLANFLNPISAFVMAIFMAFYNLFGGWFGFIEETPETPDVGSPEDAIVYETTDPAEVAAIYVELSDRTYAEYDYIEGKQTMTLAGEITGDGAIGTIVEIISPVINAALENNSYDVYTVPGSSRGDLRADDIAECCYREYYDGTASIEIKLKKQVDGPDEDMHEAGPVARGIGTVGSVDSALEELGAEITSGRDTISLTYRDAYIMYNINDSGYIDNGMCGYDVDVHIGSAKANLAGFSMNLKNIDATIEYRVTLYP